MGAKQNKKQAGTGTRRHTQAHTRRHTQAHTRRHTQAHTRHRHTDFSQEKSLASQVLELFGWPKSDGISSCHQRAAFVTTHSLHANKRKGYTGR